MSKHIWDLTPQDLAEHALWQLPMWKGDSDEKTVVMPATIDDAFTRHSKLLVKAKFVDASGAEFVGYIYYGLTEIEYSQPCMFVKGKAINFWLGTLKHNEDEADLVKFNFPIVATSAPIHGLVARTVIIKGYDYFTEVLPLGQYTANESHKMTDKIWSILLRRLF